jgi:hypothetical protein
LTVPIRPSSRNREASLTAARTQKRSMSVQDRSSRGRRSNVSPLLNPHHQPTQSREEYDLEKLRSSSSLSGRFPSGKMGLGVSADRERERLTATEWLGPRTVKAFSSRAHGSRSRAGIRQGQGQRYGAWACSSSEQVQGRIGVRRKECVRVWPQQSTFEDGVLGSRYWWREKCREESQW